MISKSRLEELIEQEAKVWVVYDEDRIDQIKLVVRMFGVSVEEYNKLHNCEPMLYSQFFGVFRDICPISWVFETEEDAKWESEFKKIPRTDYLDLPTWEEFNEMSSFIFKNKDGINLEMAIWFCDREDLQIRTIKITNLNDWNIRLFEQPLTKETRRCI